MTEVAADDVGEEMMPDGLFTEQQCQWLSAQMRKHSAQLDSLRSEHSAQLGSLRSEHSAQLGSLRSEIDVINAWGQIHEQRLDEVDGYFSLRECVTRLDRVIVTNLLPSVGPFDLRSPGTPIIVLGTITCHQLFHLLKREDNQFRQTLLPRPFDMETLEIIASALSGLKYRADDFAQTRDFTDEKLATLVDSSIPPFMSGCGEKSVFASSLIEWIHENYSEYLKTGKAELLDAGPRIPFHQFVGRLERVKTAIDERCTMRLTPTDQKC